MVFKWGQGMLSDVPRLRPTWWGEAEFAGLQRGIYWLNDARYKAPDQVESLKRASDLDFGELGCWVDNEKPWISMTDLDYWKLPYAGIKNIIDFQYLVSLLKASHFPDYMPGFYTSPGFYKLFSKGITESQEDFLAKSPLWTAQYPWMYIPGISRPSKYGNWEKHTLWQYRAEPDINIFNGTQEEFDAMFPSMPTGGLTAERLIIGNRTYMEQR